MRSRPQQDALTLQTSPNRQEIRHTAWEAATAKAKAVETIATHAAHATHATGTTVSKELRDTEEAAQWLLPSPAGMLLSMQVARPLICGRGRCGQGMYVNVEFAV